MPLTVLLLRLAAVDAEVRGQAGVWRLRQPDKWMLLLLLYVGVSTLSGETRLLLSPRGAWRQNNQRTRPPPSRAEAMKIWFNVVKTEKPPAARISQRELLCCAS